MTLEKQKCDYCSRSNVKVASSPYLADIGMSARMCKNCWEFTRKSHAEEIGEFPAKLEFKKSK